MNQVLLGLNIMLAAFALAVYLSPKAKFWLGYRLQASALADEARQRHIKELIQRFEDGQA